jgi:hypothetical protein
MRERRVGRDAKVSTTAVVGAAVLTLVLALDGCGGSAPTDSNSSKIRQAQQSEQSVGQIHKLLVEKLSLHRYAGINDNFVVPIGGPDVYQGQSGTECSVDSIDVPATASDSSDPETLVSPDGKVGIVIVAFQGSRESRCLAGAKTALHW